MTNAVQIADANDKVNAAIADCNKLAKRYMAELLPLTKKRVDDILDMDVDQLQPKMWALIGAHSALAEARRELDALNRRNL